MSHSNVKVYCPTCDGDHDYFWEGTLLDWENQLVKLLPPHWFVKAMNHQEAHGHVVMVKYPNLGNIPLGDIINEAE